MQELQQQPPSSEREQPIDPEDDFEELTVEDVLPDMSSEAGAAIFMEELKQRIEEDEYEAAKLIEEAMAGINEGYSPDDPGKSERPLKEVYDEYTKLQKALKEAGVSVELDFDSGGEDRARANILPSLARTINVELGSLEIYLEEEATMDFKQFQEDFVPLMQESNTLRAEGEKARPDQVKSFINKTKAKYTQWRNAVNSMPEGQKRGELLMEIGHLNSLAQEMEMFADSLVVLEETDVDNQRSAGKQEGQRDIGAEQERNKALVDRQKNIAGGIVETVQQIERLEDVIKIEEEKENPDKTHLTTLRGDLRIQQIRMSQGEQQMFNAEFDFASEDDKENLREDLKEELAEQVDLSREIFHNALIVTGDKKNFSTKELSKHIAVLSESVNALNHDESRLNIRGMVTVDKKNTAQILKAEREIQRMAMQLEERLNLREENKKLLEREEELIPKEYKEQQLAEVIDLSERIEQKVRDTYGEDERLDSLIRHEINKIDMDAHFKSKELEKEVAVLQAEFQKYEDFMEDGDIKLDMNNLFSNNTFTATRERIRFWRKIGKLEPEPETESKAVEKTEETAPETESDVGEETEETISETESEVGEETEETAPEPESYREFSGLSVDEFATRLIAAESEMYAKKTELEKLNLARDFWKIQYRGVGDRRKTKKAA
ncbi:hypothetical protein KKH43_03980 [Patescibacteria group bacterium]|nr:hypothetical protein [Patescibacteria group bacterium]